MKTVAELMDYVSKLKDAPKEYKLAVGSLIFTSDDKVILLERGERARDAVGKLEGVGGGVRKTEYDLHEALQREIREEIGVEVEISDVLTIKIMPGEKDPFWVVVDYLCRLHSGIPTIKEPKKINKIHILPLSEIEEDQLSVYQQAAIKVYREKFGNVPYYKI
ncbi:NUDIX hydrolase [Candidatus Roizmanbacteria bacterium]|nr:NUDIX hydrolase [Candidatus Roizmanbacteria bacterium]